MNKRSIQLKLKFSFTHYITIRIQRQFGPVHSHSTALPSFCSLLYSCVQCPGSPQFGVYEIKRISKVWGLAEFSKFSKVCKGFCCQHALLQNFGFLQYTRTPRLGMCECNSMSIAGISEFNKLRVSDLSEIYTARHSNCTRSQGLKFRNLNKASKLVFLNSTRKRNLHSSAFELYKISGLEIS